MLKYSKQRNAILMYLKENRIHPTAKQIYEAVKKDLPNISLGTVYRNLTDMVENGEILAIAFAENEVHYDINTASHLHLHCTVCGKTQDVELSDTQIFCAALSSGFKPASSVNIVYGVCKECSAASKK